MHARGVPVEEPRASHVEQDEIILPFLVGYTDEVYEMVLRGDEVIQVDPSRSCSSSSSGADVTASPGLDAKCRCAVAAESIRKKASANNVFTVPESLADMLICIVLETAPPSPCCVDGGCERDIGDDGGAIVLGRGDVVYLDRCVDDADVS